MRFLSYAVFPVAVLVVAQVHGAPTMAPSQQVQAADDDAPSIVGIGSLAAVPQAAKTKPRLAVKKAPDLVIEGDSEPPTTPVMIAKAPKRQLTNLRTCKADDLKLAWPVPGKPAKTFVTNNYTDLDPASNAKKDYRGTAGDLAITYEGHRGYDIDVGSFRDMDANAVTANAAAPGKVIGVDDDNSDRNMACVSGAQWNYVAVEHQNGFVSYYGHLKKNSAKVKVGDTVFSGQALGIVGSSGCSTAPHLHFELHDCDNSFVDAAQKNMWKAPPAQLEVSGILDMFLRVSTPTINAPGLSSAQMKDPAPNPTTMTNKQVLSVGASMALKAGDVVSGGVFLTTGELRTGEWTVESYKRYGHKWVYWSNYQFPAGYTGPAYISLFVNGSLKAIRMITITAP